MKDDDDDRPRVIVPRRVPFAPRTPTRPDEPWPAPCFFPQDDVADEELAERRSRFAPPMTRRASRWTATPRERADRRPGYGSLPRPPQAYATGFLSVFIIDATAWIRGRERGNETSSTYEPRPPHRAVRHWRPSRMASPLPDAAARSQLNIITSRRFSRSAVQASAQPSAPGRARTLIPFSTIRLHAVGSLPGPLP